MVNRGSFLMPPRKTTCNFGCKVRANYFLFMWHLPLIDNFHWWLYWLCFGFPFIILAFKSALFLYESNVFQTIILGIHLSFRECIRNQSLVQKQPLSFLLAEVKKDYSSTGASIICHGWLILEQAPWSRLEIRSTHQQWFDFFWSRNAWKRQRETWLFFSGKWPGAKLNFLGLHSYNFNKSAGMSSPQSLQCSKNSLEIWTS